MNKLLVVLSSVLILISCCTDKDKSLFFVIPTPELKENEYPIFYSDKNFILYDDSTIYFHHEYVQHLCGVGIDFSRPSFLSLHPDTLKTVKFTNIIDFLDSISKTSGNNRIISISSPKDTIRNPALLVIRKYYKGYKNSLVGIRKSTEEEMYVSEAKFRHKPYHPKSIKWKIGFDFDKEVPTELETLKFIPAIEN